MVNLNEIRLGSPLQQGIVSEILPDGISVLDPTNNRELVYSPFEITPIALSRELLVDRYGFFEHSDSGAAYLHLPGLCLSRDDISWRIYSTTLQTTYRLRYQHELENLHAALYHREIGQADYLPTADDKQGLTVSIHALRMGNLVYGKTVNGHHNQIIKVKGLRKEGVIWSDFTPIRNERGVAIIEELDVNDPMLPGWLDPVPLSNETIERFGFRPINRGNGIYRFDRFVLVFSGLQATLQEDNHHFGRPFQYVHQLQNLYYALTHIELAGTVTEFA